MDKVLCTLVHDSPNGKESQIIIISEVEGKGSGVGWCFFPFKGRPMIGEAHRWIG